MKVTSLLILALLSTLSLHARIWTNKEGKTLEAELISLNESSVILKLSNGKEVPLALNKLSPTDLKFLKQTQAKVDTGIDTPDKWPEKILGPTEFKLKQIKARKEHEGKTIYQTEHFKFVCDTELDPAAQEAVGKLYESTWAAIRAMPLPIPRVKRKSYLFDAVLAKNNESYLAAGGPPGSAGVFTYSNAITGRKMRESDIKSDKTIVPYPNLGFSIDGKLANPKLQSHVLAHEITHQMTVGLFDGVTWINEGLADYVGYIPYDGHEFDFTGAFQAILKAGKRYSPMLLPYSFEKFLNMEKDDFYDMAGSNGSRNYALGTLIVAFFFHLDGKEGIKNFTEYISALTKKSKSPLKKLLNKRTIKELEEAFITAWKKQGVDISFSSQAQ